MKLTDKEKGIIISILKEVIYKIFKSPLGDAIVLEFICPACPSAKTCEDRVKAQAIIDDILDSEGPDPSTPRRKLKVYPKLRVVRPPTTTTS